MCKSLREFIYKMILIYCKVNWHKVYCTVQKTVKLLKLITSIQLKTISLTEKMFLFFFRIQICFLLFKFLKLQNQKIIFLKSPGYSQKFKFQVLAERKKSVCCIVTTNYTYTCRNIVNTIMTNEHTSLEKYTSHTLFSKGLRKGYERVMCER